MSLRSIVLLTTVLCTLLMAPEASATLHDDIRGTSGDDVLTGTPGSDSIRAFSGDDQVRVGEGRDSVDAGVGRDVVRGGPGGDSLDGGAGRDLVATYGFEPDDVDTFYGCERFDSSCRTAITRWSQGREICSIPRHISSVVPSPHTM